MMVWVARTVRGAFLIALVLAVVTSANHLMASTKGAPNAAVASDSTPAEVVTLPVEDEDQVDIAAADDEAIVDQPVDLPTDLSDTELANAIDVAALGVEDQLAPDTADVVELVAPPAPEAAPEAASEAAPEGADLASDAAAPGQYKRTVIAKLPYGSGAASVGVSTGANRRPVGPMSFTVDAAGAIYVSDNVNGRVQVYSTKGSHLRSLKADTYVYDLTADGSSDLYLLGTNGGVVIQDAQTGKVKAKGSASGAAANELGKLRAANGQVTLETSSQVAYPVAAGQAGSMQLLTSKQQAGGQAKGAPTRSQSRYTTSYRDGGHLYRLDSKGKTVQDIALRLSDIATIVFLQEDRAGNAYVQVERASANGQVKVEVRQFGKKGELVSVVPLDRVDYVPMTRSTIVTEDGTIYQLVPTAQGITLVKHQRS